MMKYLILIVRERIRDASVCRKWDWEVQEL